MAITDVKRLSELASTALATYAYFLNENELAFRLTRPDSEQGVGMTESQANKFDSQYNILDIRPNDLTGFAATLFEDTTDGGKKVLALRGTEFTQGWGQIITDGALADALGIGVAGFANFQAVQLYRYVKQLSTDGGQVVQYSDDDIVKIFMLANAAAIESLSIVIPPGSVHDIAQWVLQQSGFSNLHNDLNQDRGIGTGAALLQSGDKIDVTGHSLGGHLALLFARMFPQYTDQVVTLNAPTFFSYGDTFLTSIGFPPGSGNNITRLEADGDVVHNLGNVDPGYAISIAQEDFGISGAISDNHSSVNGVDGLNLMALFAQLDPSLINSPMQISDLIRKASNDYKNTYEKTLDFLRHFVLGENITDTVVSTGSTDPNRASLYSNMNALISSTTFQAIAGRVTLTSSPTNISEIRDNFGAFLSLYHLSPFAIKANDITADNALKNANLSLKYQWEADADLTSEEITSGEANFSDMWIADRLAMLSWVNKRNNEDASGNKIFDGPDSLFWDEATQTEIQVGSFFVTEVDRRQFKFGDDSSNVIEGGNKNDRLYGMAGNDTIVGGSGDDVLDGGAGQDTLNGGSGRDILFGGADEDSLNGGAGNDRLWGGAGVDAYQFSDSYGIDIVDDTDGQGVVLVNNIALNSASLKLAGIYKNDITGYTFTNVNGGNNLIISKENDPNRIIINNWSATNSLGITLNNDAPITPSGNIINGDIHKSVDDKGTPDPYDDVYFYSDLNYINDGTEVDARDMINGASGNDVIYGFGGDDFLSGGAGVDYIYGGADDDLLQGGTGKDYLYGGDGNDVVYAGAGVELNPKSTYTALTPAQPGSHTVVGSGFSWLTTVPNTAYMANGAWQSVTLTIRPGDAFLGASDVLSDGSSNYIDGGSGNDFVIGSSGSEYVLGGNGNDTVIGYSGDDIVFGGADNDFLVGDSIDDRTYTGNDILDGGSGNDIIVGSAGDDILYGGAGDDHLWGDYADGVDNVEGNDFLFGGAGNDQLAGGAGNDYLDGGDDDDTLYGGAGNDILIGGAGADSFIGGTGADTIYLNILDGDQLLGNREIQDTVIYDIKKSQIQQLTTDVDENGLITSGIIRIGAYGSQNKSNILSANLTNNNLSSIGVGLIADADFYHHFADGDILNSELIGKNLWHEIIFSSEALTMFGGAMDDNLVSTGTANSSLYGGLGNDRLVGNSGDNILIGGLGDDILDGYEGNNLYILEGASSSAQYDKVYEGGVASFQFGQGVELDNLILVNSYSANEVIIKYPSIDGVNNILSINLGLTASINLFKFEGGTSLTFDQLVSQKITPVYISGTVANEDLKGSYANDVISGGGGQDYLYGGFGNDLLNGEDGDDIIYGDRGNDTLLGGNGMDDIDAGEGDDILNGGAGNDTLRGGNGNDTYYFEAGFGTDNIVEYINFNTQTGAYDVNTIEFGPGINPADLIFSMSGSNFLTISIQGTTDKITGLRYFGIADTALVSVIKFADGTQWGVNEINNKLFGSTSGNDLIYGFDSQDYINGGLGDDRVYGRNGNDTLIGSIGSDFLYGESGEDILLGQEDNDYLDGGDGNDLLDGGLGSNQLYGQGGDDRLILGSGSDYANGGRGNDTYVFGLDSGTSSIYNAARNWVVGPDGYYAYDSLPVVDYTDGIELGQGITADNLLIFRNQYDRILFTIYEQTSNVILYDQLVWEDDVQSLGYQAIDFIKFADGTIWDAATVLNKSVLLNNIFSTSWQPIITYGTSTDDANMYTEAVAYGLDGNDQIWGSNEDNYIVGGAGNDYLSAANGSDSYVFDIGHGHDIIENLDTQAASSVDQIIFNNINSTSAVFTKSGSDLVITTGTNSSVTLKDFGLSIDNQIDVIHFADGVSFDAQFLNSVMNAASEGDDIINGTSGDDVIHGLGGNDTISGGLGNDQLFGDAGNDTLNGGGGEDLLDGGEGSDQMTGGAGNDTYVIDSSGDVVTESSNGGTDTVRVATITPSGTYTLGSNVENGILINSVAFNLTGNNLNNILTGNASDNILNGGAGTDILVGGDGNDTYIVDSTADTITETVTGGVDTVQSSVTFTLGASSNLENLTLTGTTAINGTGNSLDNVLVGNSGNNTLNGGAGNDTLNGGAGTDTLVGGDGNDTYIVDSTTDTITETSTGGVDTVQSSVTYTLGATSNLENLTLTGTSAINGTGNTLNNVITGNSAANTLNGGAGVDTLVGGDGNDIYIVDSTTDSITETTTGGIDTVQSSVTYTLGAASNLENLTLTGTTAINGTGNGLDNILTGNSANNTLSGGAGNDTLNGGAGTDTLVGGDGNDIYVVDSTTDTITETTTGGIDTVQSSVTYTLGASSNLENLTLTGTSAINGTGNSLSNFLLGNSGNNTLTDTAGGNDILQGLGGVDTVNDTSGNNLLDGGVGADVITSGSGNDLIIGGTSNDTITTGNGFDVIMFNKGDGADTINASVGTDNTLSLGGNFAYSDLSLTKSASDLILKMGTTDQITLKGWYNTGANNKSVLNLQVIAEAMQGFSLGGSDTLRNNKVETFNFANLVSAFDAAGATANWQLTDARLTAHLSAGSDTAAIGGDLAYQYGKAGSLTGVGLLAAQAVINNASVGQSAQTLNASSSWAAETIKLS